MLYHFPNDSKLFAKSMIRVPSSLTSQFEETKSTKMKTNVFTSYSQDESAFPPVWSPYHSPSGHSSHNGAKRMIVEGRVDESRETISLVLDVPGVKPTDLRVTMNNGTIKVSGSRKIPGDDQRWFENEYSVDQSSVDTTEVKANVLDGVLVIVFKKKETITVSRTVELSPPEASTKDQKNNAAQFSIDVGGAKPDELKVDVSNGVVKIVGKRKARECQSFGPPIGAFFVAWWFLTAVGAIWTVAPKLLALMFALKVLVWSSHCLAECHSKLHSKCTRNLGTNQNMGHHCGAGIAGCFSLMHLAVLGALIVAAPKLLVLVAIAMALACCGKKLQRLACLGSEHRCAKRRQIWLAKRKSCWKKERMSGCSVAGKSRCGRRFRETERVIGQYKVDEEQFAVDKTTATLTPEGVLNVTIPKRERAASRSVQDTTEANGDMTEAAPAPAASAEKKVDKEKEEEVAVVVDGPKGAVKVESTAKDTDEWEAVE